MRVSIGHTIILVKSRQNGMVIEMGYCMNIGESNITIKKEKFEMVVKAIQDLHGKETCEDTCRGKITNTHFSWVDDDFYKYTDIKEIFEAWRWSPVLNEVGDIKSLSFTGEKYGDEDTLFKAIAPFVEDGSFISACGEDGDIWAWGFDGGWMGMKKPTWK